MKYQGYQPCNLLYDCDTAFEKSTEEFIFHLCMSKRECSDSVPWLTCTSQVAREIQIHSHLQHEHIIQLYGAFEDSKHIYLVQEFAPGMLCYVRTPTIAHP